MRKTLWKASWWQSLRSGTRGGGGRRRRRPAEVIAAQVDILEPRLLLTATTDTATADDQAAADDTDSASLAVPPEYDSALADDFTSEPSVLAASYADWVDQTSADALETDGYPLSEYLPPGIDVDEFADAFESAAPDDGLPPAEDDESAVIGDDESGAGTEEAAAGPTPPAPVDARLEWQPFVLPDGFEFEPVALPAEAFLEDLLLLTPEGTTSFTTDTRYDSAPVIMSTDGPLGVGTREIAVATRITLSQTWIGPGEWTITQTREQTYASNELAADDDGGDYEFDRFFTTTYTISVINGERAVVTYALSDTSTFAASESWNRTSAASETLAPEEGAGTQPIASSTIDQGDFAFNLNRTATSTTSVEVSRITLAGGTVGTRYVLSYNASHAADHAAAGQTQVNSASGSLVDEPLGGPVDPPSEDTSPSSESNETGETDTGVTSDDSTANGTRVDLSTHFSASGNSQVNLNATRQYDVPDDPSLPTIVTGSASLAASGNAATGHALELGLQVQQTSGRTAGSLSYSTNIAGNSNGQHAFSAAVTFDEEQTSGSSPIVPSNLATASAGDAFNGSSTAPPEISLEMSLADDSQRTEEIHVTFSEALGPDDLPEGVPATASRQVAYHSTPTASNSSQFDVQLNEAGQLVLVFAASSTAGFVMTASEVTDFEYNHTPGGDFYANELMRTEHSTRDVQESRDVAETTTVSLTLDPAASLEDLPIDVTTTRSITAAGSDVTQTTTVWHVWEHPAEVLDPETFDWENPGTALDPVFIEDIPTETLVSLTYNYTDDGTGSPQGTSVFLQREEGGRYDNPDGTLSTGTWQITITTDLTTGDQTTDITSTFPPEIHTPSPDSLFEPGSYLYYLFNPSEMDDGLEDWFYGLGISGGAFLGSLLFVEVAAASLTAELVTLSIPTFGWTMTGGGAAAWGIIGTTTVTVTAAEAIAAAGLTSAAMSSYRGDSDQFEPMGGGNNQYHNKKAEYIAKKVGLNPKQTRELHNQISKMGYSLDEIWEIARNIKAGG